MYILTYPKLVSKNDVSFFNGGFRLSSSFVNKEKIVEYKSVSIYVDKEKEKLGLSLHKDNVQHSLPLTPSSKNTSGKTVWCSYLKEYPFIKWVMEDPNIKNRRFPINITDLVTLNRELIKYEIDLSKYAGIPF